MFKNKKLISQSLWAAFFVALLNGSANAMMSGAGQHAGPCKPQSAGTELKAQQGSRLPRLDNPDPLCHGQQPQLSKPQLITGKKMGFIKKFFVRWQAKRVARAVAQKKAAVKKNKNKHAKK